MPATETYINTQLARPVRIVAALTMAIALLVTTGWLAHIPLLTSVGPGMPTMKFNTALCILLLGVALWQYTVGYSLKSLQKIILLYVVPVFWGAAVTSLQYYLGNNFGIDELFIADTHSPDSYPGRMSNASAVCLMLISTALMFPGVKQPLLRQLLQALLHVVSFIAFVGILGYVFSIPAFYKLSFVSSMAVHTSVLFFLIAGVATLLRPEAGLTGLLLGKRVGNTVMRQMLVFMAVSALVLGYIRMYSFRHGVVSEEFGIALAALSYLMMGISVVSYIAFRLNKTDEVRLQAENRLSELNKELESIVTERTRELQLSETRFRNAFNFSATGMAMVSTTGQWLQVNNAVCNMLGYNEQEMLQLTFQDITHPDDLDADLRNVQKLLKGVTDTYQMEKRYYHKNGSIVWVLLSVSLLHNADGSPYSFLAQIQDITGRKKADEELTRVNRELTAILNSGTHVSIIATDTTGLISHFSKGAETLLGYTANEIVGKQTPGIFHSKEEVEKRGKKLTERYGRTIHGFDVFVESARQGYFESREWTYVRKDGTTFPVQLVVTAVRNEKNELTGFLGIATDLTETKATEQALRKVAEAEAKTRELEQLTYIASHDLQEPLRSMSTFTDMLYKNYADRLDEKGRTMLEYSRSSAARMSELIQGLLVYSRIGNERHLEVTDTGNTVAHVLLDLNETINRTNATVTTANLPTLKVYPVEFRQLMQNLISNALKFARPGVPPQVHIQASHVGNSLLFTVADNGIGIDEKDRQKVFILFKRLHDRADYDGTGIGLAHCKKIVELHGGNIWVEANPAGGSVFCFTINT